MSSGEQIIARQDRRGWRSFTIMAVGALLAACFLHPLIGVLSAFFEHLSAPAGVSAEGAAAERIINGEYWRSYRRVDLPVRQLSEVASPCEGTVFLREQNDPILADLHEAIRTLSSRRRRRVTEEPIYDAVQSLPFPILGMLEGCLGKSLLSRFCERMLEDVTERATKQSAASVRTSLANINNQTEKMWCAAANRSLTG
jgi:hypothetical protein